MAEYIKREDAINAIESLPTWWADEGGYYGGMQQPRVALLEPEDVINAIKNIPSADVQPVVHGEWSPFLPEYRDMFRCSKCKVIVRLPFKTDQMPYEFCPGCGARMDGGT